MLLTKVCLLLSLAVFVQPRPQPEMKIIIHLHGLDVAGAGGIDNGMPVSFTGYNCKLITMRSQPNYFEVLLV